MKIFLILGIAVFAALSTNSSFAESSKKPLVDSQSTTKSGITKEEAKASALKLVPGKIIEVERERHNGEPVFSIEIRGEDGVHEVVIRIADGSVVENKAPGTHEDDDEDEDDDN